jgi:hypothetical protein
MFTSRNLRGGLLHRLDLGFDLNAIPDQQERAWTLPTGPK